MKKSNRKPKYETLEEFLAEARKEDLALQRFTYKMGVFFWIFIFILTIVCNEISILTFIAIPSLLMFVHLLKETYKEPDPNLGEVKKKYF